MKSFALIAALALTTAPAFAGQSPSPFRPDITRVQAPTPPPAQDPGVQEPPASQEPQGPVPKLPDPHSQDPHEGLVTAPDQLPKLPKNERVRNLDFLFGALKVAPDDASAKSVEDRIWAAWMSTGNETSALLMSRAKKAVDEKDYDLALRLLSEVIEIKPDFMEAWNRRATVYFLQRDYAKSLADISKVLEREPRHFGALSGLGLIMQDLGDEKHAIEAFRKAVEVYPRLKGMQDRIKSLADKVDGRNI